jgi:hypothetical protein
MSSSGLGFEVSDNGETVGTSPPSLYDALAQIAKLLFRQRFGVCSPQSGHGAWRPRCKRILLVLPDVRFLPVWHPNPPMPSSLRGGVALTE